MRGLISGGLVREWSYRCGGACKRGAYKRGSYK